MPLRVGGVFCGIGRSRGLRRFRRVLFEELVAGDGVGGGWVLVPVFNLVMGLPLKVACSEATIALGDAAAAAMYLSAGFRLFGVDAGGPRWGLFWGRGWCGWWFCLSPRLRRDLLKASRRRPAVVGAARPEGFRLGGVVVWRLAPRRSSPCFSWRRRLGVVLCGLFDFFQGLLYLFFYFLDGFWWGCGG